MACGLFAGPALAQSNAEADLYAVGDLLGGPLQVEVDGAIPNAITYLLPSLDLAGSNYLVGLSGDPNDIAATGTTHNMGDDASFECSQTLGGCL